MIVRKLKRAKSISHTASFLQRGTSWPYVGIIFIVGIAASLRFWQLARFNALVFDEVYFANFAEAYRQGIASTDAHPPLGKYIIAAATQLSVWLKGDAEATGLNGSPAIYRQANALVGSLLPIIVVCTARTIAKRSSYLKVTSQWMFALLSGLFVTIDGLFIVESRYALLNVYVVFFGLLSHLLWLRKWRIASGISLGMAIATKWNGLGYLLSLATWEIYRTVAYKNNRQGSIDTSEKSLIQTKISQVKNRTSANTVKDLTKDLALLALVTLLTYSLIWWPHLHIAQENIFSTHTNLIRFHQQLGTDGHSACSKWYSWPLLTRPITYWHSQTHLQSYTVSNLGNPALWLFSASAISLLLVGYLLRAKHFLLRQLSIRRAATSNPHLFKEDGLASYLVVSYLCNWLPWTFVQRCTFNYLYMPAAVFSFMASAWLLSTWLSRSTSKPRVNKPRANKPRVIAIAILTLIAIAFIFWLPLSLGLPLSPEQLQRRWLLKSWI